MPSTVQKASVRVNSPALFSAVEDPNSVLGAPRVRRNDGRHEALNPPVHLPNSTLDNDGGPKYDDSYDIDPFSDSGTSRALSPEFSRVTSDSITNLTAIQERPKLKSARETARRGISSSSKESSRRSKRSCLPVTPSDHSPREPSSSGTPNQLPIRKSHDSFVLDIPLPPAQSHPSVSTPRTRILNPPQMTPIPKIEEQDQKPHLWPQEQKHVPDSPDSDTSQEGSEDYGFWDTAQTSEKDDAFTPLTPPSSRKKNISVLNNNDFSPLHGKGSGNVFADDSLGLQDPLTTTKPKLPGLNTSQQDIVKHDTTSNILDQIYGDKVKVDFTSTSFENQCITSNNKTLQRCRNKLPSDDHKKIKDTLSQLFSLDISADLGEHIEILNSATLLFCVESHRQNAQRRLRRWVSERYDKLRKDQDESALPKLQTTTSQAIIATPAQHQEHSVLVFSPFLPKCSGTLNDQEAAIMAMKKHLTPRDQKSGYIYIYCYGSNVKYQKIGATTRSIKKRMQEWEKTCGQHITLIYPAKAEDGKLVKNVFRLEKLVQASLKKYRQEGIHIKPTNCSIKHKEWFCLEHDNYVRIVVQYWISWLNSEPYEKVSKHDCGAA
ncbi:hypothetical protein MMC06_005492 [Schaereria dolodes]|nr:hypothetical protein [Schaereria dolodes]